MSRKLNRNNYFYIAAVALLISAPVTFAADYRHLEWADLQTLADQIAMQHLPPIDHTKPPNFNADPMAGFSDLDANTIARNLEQQQATAVLHSTSVRSELNGTNVQMEGYIVPLETNNRGAITEFFLAPYIGACIHVPPPPPNQMVYVRYSPGIDADLINEAIRVEGKLLTETTNKPQAQAAYFMTADRAYEYKAAK